MKKEAGPTLYGTKQVAEILGIPEWRVKNFSEGEAYGLPPTHRIGSGRGSRRLYEVRDILRVAVANELLKYGFAPEAIGRAIREIPESMLILSLRETSDPPVLICFEGEFGWRTKKSSDASEMVAKILEGRGKTHGIFVLHFVPLLKGVIDKMCSLRRSANRKENADGTLQAQ